MPPGGRIELSARARGILLALRAKGSAPDARAEWLRSAAGSENALFNSLEYLGKSGLIRWEAGGVNIRLTVAGKKALLGAGRRPSR